MPTSMAPFFEPREYEVTFKNRPDSRRFAIFGCPPDARPLGATFVMSVADSDGVTLEYMAHYLPGVAELMIHHFQSLPSGIVAVVSLDRDGSLSVTVLDDGCPSLMRLAPGQSITRTIRVHPAGIRAVVPSVARATGGRVGPLDVSIGEGV